MGPMELSSQPGLLFYWVDRTLPCMSKPIKAITSPFQYFLWGWDGDNTAQEVAAINSGLKQCWHCFFYLSFLLNPFIHLFSSCLL